MNIHDPKAEVLGVEVRAGPLEVLLVLLGLGWRVSRAARIHPHPSGVLRRTGDLSARQTANGCSSVEIVFLSGSGSECAGTSRQHVGVGHERDDVEEFVGPHRAGE